MTPRELHVPNALLRAFEMRHPFGDTPSTCAISCAFGNNKGSATAFPTANRQSRTRLSVKSCFISIPEPISI